MTIENLSFSARDKWRASALQQSAQRVVRWWGALANGDFSFLRNRHFCRDRRTAIKAILMMRHTRTQKIEEEYRGAFEAWLIANFDTSVYWFRRGSGSQMWIGLGLILCIACGVVIYWWMVPNH